MEENIESTLNFLILQEKELLNRIDDLDGKAETPVEEKILRDLRVITDKNSKLYEHILHNLDEIIRCTRLENVVLDDYTYYLPKRNGYNYQTLLLFIMKTLVGSTKLLNAIIGVSNDTSLNNDILALVTEKKKLKAQVEKIYDKQILNDN